MAELSALATAFSPPTVRRSQPAQPSPAPAPPPAAGDSTPTDVDLSSSVSTDGSWKSEYDSQVQSWRAQSAEAREKSERERARWEEIRAREKQEGGSRHRQTVEEAAEPSPADVRDLVSGEHEVNLLQIIIIINYGDFGANDSVGETTRHTLPGRQPGAHLRNTSDIRLKSINTNKIGCVNFEFRDKHCAAVRQWSHAGFRRDICEKYCGGLAGMEVTWEWHCECRDKIDCGSK